jgi:hypothetical protein
MQSYRHDASSLGVRAEFNFSICSLVSGATKPRAANAGKKQILGYPPRPLERKYSVLVHFDSDIPKSQMALFPDDNEIERSDCTEKSNHCGGGSGNARAAINRVCAQRRETSARNIPQTPAGCQKASFTCDYAGTVSVVKNNVEQ